MTPIEYKKNMSNVESLLISRLSENGLNIEDATNLTISENEYGKYIYLEYNFIESDKKRYYNIFLYEKCEETITNQADCEIIVIDSNVISIELSTGGINLREFGNNLFASELVST
jgi:hypothetical protein